MWRQQSGRGDSFLGSQGSLFIKRNYRNSREILGAAYALLQADNALEKLKSEDFDIIEPEYANFSTPKPLLLKADSLAEELGYCYNYLKTNLEPHQKACIALFAKCLDKFNLDIWKKHIENSTIENFRLPELIKNKHALFLNMTGREFIYTPKAIGISAELHDKLLSLITGKSITQNGMPIEWKTISDALQDKNIPNISALFGRQKTYPEFKQLFENSSLPSRSAPLPQ